MKKIKVVKWQGRLDCYYEEIGEIELMEVNVGRNGEGLEICIDVEDLLDFIENKIKS